jgi:hypothetical protein
MLSDDGPNRVRELAMGVAGRTHFSLNTSKGLEEWFEGDMFAVSIG